MQSLVKGTAQEVFQSRVMSSEEEFKQVGLARFFDTDDDTDVDWEDVFSAKKANQTSRGIL